MKIEEVKCLLVKRKVKFSDIDRKYNLNYGGARRCLSYPYAKGEEALSDFLGISLKDLFPDRYDKNNNILKPIPLSVYKYKREYEDA